MIRMLLDAWRCFLDSLDSGGGHIVVLIVIIAVGYRMFQSDPTAGGQMINLSFGALLALLKTAGSNRQQMAATPDAPVAPGPPPPV